MISIVLFIGLGSGIVKLSSQVRKDKKLILEKGVSEDSWTLFTYSLWLFALPPLAAALFPGTYSVLGAVIFACFYLPTILLSRKLSAKVSKGYDFERKAGRNIERIKWLGYAGIGLVVFNWAIINVFQMLNDARR
jgi:hypothetical protein